MKLDPLKILSVCILLTGFVSAITFLVFAVTGPNLRPALDAEHAFSMIQSSTDLEKLRQLAIAQTHTIESFSGGGDRLIEDACLALLFCAICSGVGLIQLQRLKKSKHAKTVVLIIYLSTAGSSTFVMGKRIECGRKMG
jgi:hypothetical protein